RRHTRFSRDWSSDVCSSDLCGIHGVVAGLCPCFISVEGVAVLHGEFAPTHQAEAGAAFVAKLGLNMVEVAWELAPAVDFISHDVRNDLFGGGLQNKIAAVPILDSQ